MLRVTQQSTSCETDDPVQRHHVPLQAANGQPPGAEYEQSVRRLRDVIWAFGHASTVLSAHNRLAPRQAMPANRGRVILVIGTW